MIAKRNILSRRDLLRRGGRAAVGLGLLTQVGWQVGCGSSAQSGLSELESQLSGVLLVPDDPQYALRKLPDNRAYANTHPLAVALCQSAQDVQACVRWGRENGAPVVARSGGHSYAGWCTTNGILVDTTAIDYMNINASDLSVDIGGGGLLGPIDDYLTTRGITVPAGRCRGVGLAGLVLGGGFGFSCRPFGLTSDNMIATDVVTADGELVRASANENSDLYWACRGGGGGNFGINVGFTMQAYEVAGPTSTYRIVWDPQDAGVAWEAMQAALVSAPNEFALRLGSDVNIDPQTRERSYSIEAIGQYLGVEDELRQILEPVINASNPTFVETGEGTFAEATLYLAEVTKPVPYVSKSAYLDEPLDAQGIQQMLDGLSRFPQDSHGACFTVFSWGGAIRNVAPDATAFVHREADFVVQSIAEWRDDSPADAAGQTRAWIDALFAELAPKFNGYAYQNFMDRGLENWQQAYYGENFARLVEVKNAWDPDDFFSFGQSIPTSL